MEARRGQGSNTSGDESDDTSHFRLVPRTNNNPNKTAGSSIPFLTSQVGPPEPVSAEPVNTGLSSIPVKKKRGRPRKYAADGSALRPNALSPNPISSSAPPPTVIDFSVGQRGSALPAIALSPKPISSSAPPPSVIDFSVGRRGSALPGIVLSPKPISSSAPPPPSVIDFLAGQKGSALPTIALSAIPISSAPPSAIDFSVAQKGKVRTVGSDKDSSSDADFTTHAINVNVGEDVNMKIVSFCQEGLRTICIVSANGALSTVTLSHPTSSGSTTTIYEDRFEILSLNGSFTPSESGGIKTRVGGLSVSLGSSNGAVIGGVVAGLLVAATPVQIVVGSFLAPNQPKIDHKASTTRSSQP